MAGRRCTRSSQVSAAVELRRDASQPQSACGFGRSLDAIAWLGVLQSAEGFTPKRFALLAVGLAMTFVAFCRGAGFPTEWSGA